MAILNLLLFSIYCLLLPLEEMLVFTTGSKGATLSQYLGILIIFFLSLELLVSRRPLRLGKAQLWLALFVGFACLSLWWSIAPEPTTTRIPTTLSLLVFYLVIGTLRPGKKGLEILIMMIVTSGLVASLYMIYTYHFLDLRVMETRASIIYKESNIDPNIVAFSLLLPFSFLISNTVQACGKWPHMGYGLGLSATGYAILLTGSRGGMLGMAMIIAFYFWLKKGKGIKLISFALIILVTEAIFKSEVLLRRISFQDSSFEHARGDIWRTGLSVLPDYWFLGTGLDSFPTLIGLKSVYPWASHSIFIGTIVELGIVGLFLMVMALVFHLKALGNSNLSHQDVAFALKAAFMGMLVQAASLDVLWKKPFWLVLSLTIMLYTDGIGASKHKKLGKSFSRNVPHSFNAKLFGSIPVAIERNNSNKHSCNFSDTAS